MKNHKNRVTVIYDHVHGKKALEYWKKKEKITEDDYSSGTLDTDPEIISAITSELSNGTMVKILIAPPSQQGFQTVSTYNTD
jgi:hypothetical protein